MALLHTSYGIELRATSLSYNLLTLSAELRGVEVASEATPNEPFASTPAIGASFGPRTLLGEIDLHRLSIESPRLAIRRHPNGADNLPRAANASSGGDSFAFPPLVVDDVEVSYEQPALSARLSGAVVRLSSPDPGRLAVSIDAGRGLTAQVGGRTVGVELGSAAIDVDSGGLAIRQLTASRQGTTLRADGRITFEREAAGVDVALSTAADLETLWSLVSDAPGPAGRVDASARITGRLAQPTVAFEANAPSLDWSGFRVGQARVTGTYSGDTLALETIAARAAGGTVAGGGTIALSPGRSSRLEARWMDVDVGRLPGAAGLEGIVTNDGSAVLEWRRAGTAPTRFDVRTSTGLIAAGETIPVVFRASGSNGQWHIEAAPGPAARPHFAAVADVRLDSNRWQRSPVDGRFEYRTADLPRAILIAKSLGAPLELDPASAAGAVDLFADIGGTLGGVRATGRVSGRAVTIAGLPTVDLAASFDADLAKEHSTGTFHLVVPDLRSTLTSERGVDLAGSLTADGSWHGSLREPEVDVTLSARSLAFVQESTAIAATGGAFDGTLHGPIGDLAGRGRLGLGAARVSGREAGDLAADLTLSAGMLRIAARVPAFAASLDATVGLAEPHAFDGSASVSSYALDGLATQFGVAANAEALRGSLSASLTFKGNLRNIAATEAVLDLAAVDVSVFDVPVRSNRSIHASVLNGAVRVEDVTIAIGGVTVRARGAVAPGTSDGTLSLDLDGDLATLQPWLNRWHPGVPPSAAVPIRGHLEVERRADGLDIAGTIDSHLAAVSYRDRTVATDMRVALALENGRLNLREVEGSLLGGRISARGGAPLSWLNAWLPAGWHLVSASPVEPATLDVDASFDIPTLVAQQGGEPDDTLSGRVDISGHFASTLPDLAAATGEIRLDRAEVTTHGLAYAQADVTRLSLDKGRVTVAFLDWRGPGSQLVGHGSVGLLDAVDSDLRLEVDTQLGLVGALLSGRATGRLTGAFALGGHRGAWTAQSDATLSDASWLIPQQRILFSGWSGHAAIDGAGLTLTNLGGAVNGGTVRIDGRLPFASTGGDTSITIAARDIALDVPQGLHSQIGADLVWRPAESASRLEGSVEITANRYSEPVTRILQLVESLSAATGPATGSGSALPPAIARTALDVALKVTDPVVVDNSVGTVELMPDLRLGGTLESPALAGTVDIVNDSRITLGGRAYKLRESQLRFAPADGLAPTLDVMGDTRIGEYDITVRINGTPDRIETRFLSVPPLGERELYSLIVTGQVDSGAQDNSGNSFAVAAAATDILGFAGKFVGLDSVRFGAADLDLVSKDVSTAQHLTISKSLGSAFDLIFSDNLEDGTVTWVIVWKRSARDEIRLASVEDGTRSLEYRQTLQFGPGVSTSIVRRRSSAKLGSNVIESVVVSGTPGFREDEVRRNFRLDAGDVFDARRWIEDRRRLEAFYSKRGYYRVRITPRRSEHDGRVTLTYAIERGPRTVIKTTGDPLPDAAVRAMYETWRALPIADVVRTEFERIAREELARRGYYRAKVTLELPAETPGLAEVIVNVARGPRTRQLEVIWSGNAAVASDALDVVADAERSQSDVWIDPQSLTFRVRDAYARRGFLDVDVTVGEPRFDGDTAMLPVAIVEGALSRLSAVTLAGVDPARLAGAQEALGLTVGTPFVPELPAEASKRLKAYYANLGYRQAAVTHTITPGTDGAMAMAWQVREGPISIVKAVDVKGVESTNRGLVRDAVTLEPGQILSDNEVEATRRNLYEIGSFRLVDFDFEESALLPPGTEQLPIAVTIDAQEPRRFQLKYGVQFTVDRSNAGGARGLGFSAELRDRNLLGRAIQGSFGGHWEPDLQTLALLFSAPRFAGRRLRTNLYGRLRHEDSDVTETVTLSDRRREVTLEQRWRPVPPLELVWGYGFSYRLIRLFDETQQADFPGLLAGPTFSAVFDRRDSPFDATKGMFHSSSVQFGMQSLGSDFGFVRYLARESHYQPIGKITLAGNVRYGTLQGYSGTPPLTILDLFYLAGGTNSVRGYPEGSLSKLTVAGIDLGGPDLLVLNGELRFPISRWFAGAGFVDAGNTFASTSSIAFGELAVGAGVGVRIRTPLAPLRFDFAFPLTDRYGQSGLRVHFSIGQMF